MIKNTWRIEIDEDNTYAIPTYGYRICWPSAALGESGDTIPRRLISIITGEMSLKEALHNAVAVKNKRHGQRSSTVQADR